MSIDTIEPPKAESSGPQKTKVPPEFRALLVRTFARVLAEDYLMRQDNAQKRDR
jgi:hypothetical protein